MSIDRSTGIKLCSFAGLLGIAATGHYLGLGHEVEGILPFALALTRDGGGTLAGHLGTHLLVEAADRSGAYAADNARGLQNHDLHRLIGEAIARTLEKAAEETTIGPDGTAYLNSAAKAFRTNWMEVELTEADAAVAEPALLQYFTGDPEAIKKAPVLTADQWFVLVQNVASEVPSARLLALKPDPHATDALRYAAVRLRNNFASELWEVAKQAWKKDDLAWPAMLRLSKLKSI